MSDFIDVQSLSEEYIISKRKTHTSRKIIDKITVNGDLLRLFGYYLAEGSSHKQNLVFYFRNDEREYIEDVTSIIRKIWNIEPNVVKRGSVCAISIFVKPIADLFKKLFGNHAHEKSIPHWIMVLPKEKQKELIKGLWRGDGCIRKVDFCLVTSSRQLAYQTRDLLLRNSIIPAVERRPKEKLNKKQHYIEGRKVQFNHDKYHVYVTSQFLNKMSEIMDLKHPKIDKRIRSNNFVWLTEDHAILPITKVEEIPYRGPVISLAVHDTNTFVAKNFIVHNCDGSFYRNKNIIVVGGSDSAAKEALLLTQWAKKVYIVYRGDQIHPEPVNMKRIEKKVSEGKIEIINFNNLKEIKGDKFVRKVELVKPYRGSTEFSIDAVFVAIGLIPLSQLAEEIGVDVNKKGEIIINRNAETNIPGFYAAGDVVDTRFKQAITGAAEAVAAVYSAYTYIGDDNIVFTCSDE